MSVAKATQGKGREIAHEKNICQSYTSDDNFIQKEEGFRVRRMGKIEGALKLLFSFEMSGYGEGLCVSDDVGIVLSHLGPKGSVYSLRWPDSRSRNEW